VAFFPIGAVGFLLAKQIKALFSVDIVAVMFIVGGIVFLIAEKYYKPQEHFIDDVEKVSYTQALWIGIAQIFALIPGTSRAGATIIGAMFVGLTRKASAEFSFLLAFPVMCATTGYDIVKHYHEFTTDNLIVLGVGFVVSFVTAYFTIKLFLKFLQKFTFITFGIYRIVFGLFLLYIY
jgi:undecaprenyl-diphosphatase